MKEEISNSMNMENDPVFEIITPICKACKNMQADLRCKIYGSIPKEYKYAKEYNCPHRDIDENNINYKDIKNKI